MLSTASPMIGAAFESNFWIDRRIGILGQPAAHAVDARADVVHGLVQVVAPGEVHLDVRVALARRRVHLLEAGDGAQLLLERPRDELFHLERTDAGVVHADVDRRLRDVGQQVDRQAA